MLAKIIEPDVLLRLVGAAIAGGVGLSVVFAFAVLGATSFTDSRRAGRGGAALVYGALTVIALAAFAGAVVYAISIIKTK